MKHILIAYRDRYNTDKEIMAAMATRLAQLEPRNYSYYYTFGIDHVYKGKYVRVDAVNRGAADRAMLRVYGSGLDCGKVYSQHAFGNSAALQSLDCFEHIVEPLRVPMPD